MNENQTSEPVQPESPVQTEQPQKEAKPRHKYGRAFSFVSILLLIAILAAGVLAYFWYDENDKNAVLEQQNTELRSENSDLEAQQSTSTNQQEPVDNPDALVASPADDNAEILRVSKEYLCVMNSQACDTTSLTRNGGITNSEVAGDRFAQVTFGGQEFGGGGLVLKNSGGDWVVVSYGQTISEQDRAMFRIPDLSAER